MALRPEPIQRNPASLERAGSRLTSRQSFAAKQSRGSVGPADGMRIVDDAAGGPRTGRRSKVPGHHPCQFTGNGIGRTGGELEVPAGAGGGPVAGGQAFGPVVAGWHVAFAAPSMAVAARQTQVRRSSSKHARRRAFSRARRRTSSRGSGPSTLATCHRSVRGLRPGTPAAKASVLRPDACHRATRSPQFDLGL